MSRQHGALNRRKWAKARRACFERDGWRCRKCGRPGRLEAHHEPPLAPGADPYDVDGLLTLCRVCHIERHRGDSETPGRAEWRDLLKKMIHG